MSTVCLKLCRSCQTFSSLTMDLATSKAANKSNQYSTEDKRCLSLINGYCRLNSADLDIIQDIILIIFQFHGTLFQILHFDPAFKSSKVNIINNDKTAVCPKPGPSHNYYVLAGGDSVKQGIFVWRLKVNSNPFYL